MPEARFMECIGCALMGKQRVKDFTDIAPSKSSWRCSETAADASLQNHAAISF